MGADVDKRSDWWAGPWSPLQSAINNGNDNLAHFLLENGASIDVHTAPGLGRIDDLARLLGESPERISEPGGDGCQPLHFAGSVEAAQYLLNDGADIEARCVDHYSRPVQYLANARPVVARFHFSNGAVADIFSAVLAIRIHARLDQQIDHGWSISFGGRMQRRGIRTDYETEYVQDLCRSAWKSFRIDAFAAVSFSPADASE